MPTRQFTLDWSMRMSRRAIQHTSASSHHSLASPFVVAHVKADTDTMMMTNGKDEPNEPFKLIYLADSANDNLKKPSESQREREAGRHDRKTAQKKKDEMSKFLFYIVVLGFGGIQQVGEGLAESTRSVHEPVVVLLAFHQSRDELDAFGHFRQVGRDGRYGCTHSLVVHILRRACIRNKR